MLDLVERFAVLFVISCTVAQEISQPCFLKDGSLGNCRHISKCKSAQDELRRRVKPLTCSFDGIIPIVCCDDELGGITEKTTSGKSEEKCQEYLQLNIRTTITTTTTITSVELGGGVGGVDADFEEFPHMAILGYGPGGSIQFQCGGSLISDQFVLTAAHCLESREFGAVSLVRLGDFDIASDTDYAEPQNFGVAQTYPHPEYDFESFYNDIALVKLDRLVIYTKFVKPACLQAKLELEHNNLTATGWGALEYGGSLHSILQKVKLNSLPIRNCLPTYGPQVRLPRGIDEELQICGGNLQQRMDTCQGDSGGPLQLKVQDIPLTHRVVGVTSFGSNCGLVPGVYTRISNYISWIESLVWPN